MLRHHISFNDGRPMCVPDLGNVAFVVCNSEERGVSGFIMLKHKSFQSRFYSWARLSVLVTLLSF